MALAGVLAAIDSVAARLGVSTNLAEAIAAQESGFSPTAVGDQGTSFGLFQLHQGGELGALTPGQAFDPTTNATVALSQVAAVQRAHPGADPGWIAAAAQRPADPAGYAASIDSLLATHPNGWATAYATGLGAPSGTTGGVQTVSSGPLPGGNFDPLNWPWAIFGGAKSLASAGVGSVVSGLKDFAFVAIAVLFGLGLVGAGLWRALAPARERVSNATEKAAAAAPAAAALA